MRIRDVSVVSFIKESARQFIEDDVLGLSAEIAFRLIFALPPLLLFFTAISSLAEQYTGVDVFTFLQNQLYSAAIPSAVQETLALALDTVKRQDATGLLSVGIGVALWSGSGAFHAMLKALNRAYAVRDPRSVVRQRLLALGMTVGLSLLIIASFVLFVFGHRLGQWLAAQAGLGSAFATSWTVVRWPLIVLLFMFALAILYWAGPAVERSFRWISPGAVLATLLWLGATWGFSLYLRFADPGSAYGTVGAVVVLLFFLYISAIVLLIGAEVNAVLDKELDPEVVRDKATHPERQTEDPARARERAIRLAHREGRPTADLGVALAPGGWVARSSPAEPGVEPHPQPDRRRGAVIALLVSMASLVVAGVIGALKRGRAARA